MEEFIEDLKRWPVGEEVQVYPGWIEDKENELDVSFTRSLTREDLCEKNRRVLPCGMHCTGYMQRENAYLHIRDESFSPNKVVELVKEAQNFLRADSYNFVTHALRNCTLYEVVIENISRET